MAGFANRVALGQRFFAAGLALLAVIVLSAVAWHTARAGSADPAVVPRTE